tara:strand:+ start:1846 stop:3177 length:1332 start_codon:yes stop_codon:yes gene_type:complete
VSKRRGIRRRFYLELLLLGLVMALVGGYGLLKVYFWGLEDATRLSYMDIAKSVEEEKIPGDVLKNNWPEDSPQVWRGLDSVPVSALAIFPLEYHKQNVLLVRYEYEHKILAAKPSYGFTFNLREGTPRGIHFFLSYPTSAAAPLYVYHFVATTGFREQTRQQVVTLIISMTCIVVIGIVLLLARRLSDIVLHPVAELAVMARHVDEQNPDKPFDVSLQDNEIGDVARALQQSVRSIQRFHEREKQFLRQASHELRTPIAVITSALDIVDQRRALGNVDVERPLSDIRRSATVMHDIVEALLWLARAETVLPEKTSTDVAEQIELLVEDHRYLLAGRKVSVNVIASDNAIVELEQPYFRIVLSNLIRNAFEHADSGTVELRVGRRDIEISNPCVKPAQLAHEAHSVTADGFGIGLSLVGAISEKLGWQFSTELVGDFLLIRLRY